MATYKNTSDDYTITVAGGTGIFTINAANTVINGNVTQTGNLSTVDDFIVVAANNTGVITDMGMLAQTSLSTFAGLRFDTTANTWQISSSVYSNGAPIAAYANLVAGGGGSIVAGTDTEIQFNQGGTFGASANLTFDYGNNKLTLQGYQVLGNIGTIPSSVANSVVMFNNAPGTGRTGLYVTGNTITTDELISLTQARLFSIIF